MEPIEKVLEQIDAALLACNNTNSAWNDTSLAAQAIWQAASVITRLTSSGSAYYAAAEKIASHAASFVSHESNRSTAVEKMKGILLALRKDFENNYLSTVTELLRADTFADFLEQAEHLLAEGYKDAAAVIAGGVAEQHLKNLCIKHGVAITLAKPNGDIRNLKADELNSELAKANVYNKAYQKTITALLGIRNHAAHGEWDQYSKEQVKNMLAQVTDLVARYSA